MSIRVNIHPSFYHLTDNQDIVEVNGSTVGQCLDHLVKQFPSTEKVLFDGEKKLLNYVDIYVNLESIFPEELAKKVKDGDELHILPMILGG